MNMAIAALAFALAFVSRSLLIRFNGEFNLLEASSLLMIIYFHQGYLRILPAQTQQGQHKDSPTVDACFNLKATGHTKTIHLVAIAYSFSLRSRSLQLSQYST